MNDEIHVPTPVILGPDGQALGETPDAEKLKAAKTLVVAEEATTAALEAMTAPVEVEAPVIFNRRMYRDLLRTRKAEARHAAHEDAREKKLDRRRAKNAVAKQSRKANRA